MRMKEEDEEGGNDFFAWGFFVQRALIFPYVFQG